MFGQALLKKRKTVGIDSVNKQELSAIKCCESVALRDLSSDSPRPTPSKHRATRVLLNVNSLELRIPGVRLALGATKAILSGYSMLSPTCSKISVWRDSGKFVSSKYRTICANSCGSFNSAFSNSGLSLPVPSRRSTPILMELGSPAGVRIHIEGSRCRNGYFALVLCRGPKSANSLSSRASASPYRMTMFLLCRWKRASAKSNRSGLCGALKPLCTLQRNSRIVCNQSI